MLMAEYRIPPANDTLRALQENNIPEVRAHGRAPLTQICLQNGILFNCTSLIVPTEVTPNQAAIHPPTLLY